MMSSMEVIEFGVEDIVRSGLVKEYILAKLELGLWFLNYIMKRIKNICILGGGTAGFTVSSVLAKYRELSGSNFGIKLNHNRRNYE